MSNDLKRTYEAMFLVDSAVATANWDDVMAAINTVFERSGADVISINKWDDRRLAYEIAGRKRGTYILSYFKADSQVIGAIERDVQLSEVLLRVMVLKAEHVTDEDIAAPTPAMLADTDRPAEDSADRAEDGGDSAPEKVTKSEGVDEELAAVPSVTEIENDPSDRADADEPERTE